MLPMYDTDFMYSTRTVSSRVEVSVLVDVLMKLLDVSGFWRCDGVGRNARDEKVCKMISMR